MRFIPLSGEEFRDPVLAEVSGVGCQGSGSNIPEM